MQAAVRRGEVPELPPLPARQRVLRGTSAGRTRATSVPAGPGVLDLVRREVPRRGVEGRARGARSRARGRAPPAAGAHARPDRGLRVPPAAHAPAPARHGTPVVFGAAARGRARSARLGLRHVGRGRARPGRGRSARQRAAGRRALRRVPAARAEAPRCRVLLRRARLLGPGPFSASGARPRRAGRCSRAAVGVFAMALHAYDPDAAVQESLRDTPAAALVPAAELAARAEAAPRRGRACRRPTRTRSPPDADRGHASGF